MFGWQYNEKILKDYMYNHAKDFGRLYCELALDYPIIWTEFMKGFTDELNKRAGRHDTSSTNEDSVP